MNSPIATLLAFVTLLLWSSVAFLGARLSHVPPFFLVGVALSIGGLIVTFRIRTWLGPLRALLEDLVGRRPQVDSHSKRVRRKSLLRVTLKTLLVGVGGIFGYHFLLFTALQIASPVEANLLNYLWPLLIVLLSPLFLTGYRLAWHHYSGASLGLIGTGIIVAAKGLNLDVENLNGYLCAIGAAFTWAIYSLLTKRLPSFPTAAVGGFCLISGGLSLAFHYLVPTAQRVAISLSGWDWVSLIYLGVGPMGLAFYTWDAALKRGDPRIIGSLAYLTPLMSTLLLVLLGGRTLTLRATLAMILIVSGAAVGALDLLRPKREAGYQNGELENGT